MKILLAMVFAALCGLAMARLHVRPSVEAWSSNAYADHGDFHPTHNLDFSQVQ